MRQKFVPLNRRNKLGTSLLEVLISLSILSVAFLIISYGYGSGYSIINKSQHYTYGSTLAQSIIEWYKNQNFDTLETLNPLSEPTIKVPQGYSLYFAVRTTAYKTIGGKSKPYLKEVTVKVTWTYQRLNQEYTLVLLKRRPR